MKKFWDFVEKHFWMQWIISAIMVFGFFAIMDIAYPSAHEGRTWQEDFWNEYR